MWKTIGRCAAAGIASAALLAVTGCTEDDTAGGASAKPAEIEREVKEVRPPSAADTTDPTPNDN